MLCSFIDGVLNNWSNQQTRYPKRDIFWVNLNSCRTDIQHVYDGHGEHLLIFAGLSVSTAKRFRNIEM